MRQGPGAWEHLLPAWKEQEEGADSPSHPVPPLELCKHPDRLDVIPQREGSPVQS